MKVEFGGKVLEYFKDRDQSELTIDVEEIASNCCVGRLPEIKLSHRLPDNPGKYRHFPIHGINIHVARDIRTEETLTLSLSGIGPFKKLEVRGLNLVL